MTMNKKQRVTLFLDPNLLKQAKIQAVVEEMGLSALIEMAISEYFPKEIVAKKRKGGEKT